MAPDERVYAIGDIHGRYDLLIPLLAKIRDDAGRFDDARRCRIVFLGDYIDRGLQSREVLAALARLTEEDSPDLVLLKGNHEAALMAFLDDPEGAADWLDYGGLETLRSFGIGLARGLFGRVDLSRIRYELMDALRPHARLFRRMELFHRSGDVFFSHAGLDPNRPPERQFEEAMLWGQPEFLTDMPAPGLRVVHGHFDDVAPLIRPGRIGIDTGAYYTGILSAVRLDDGDAILSVRD